MTAQSNVCACDNCAGPQFTCGCQKPAPVSTAACQCGEGCKCGERCTCNHGRQANAGVAEPR